MLSRTAGLLYWIGRYVERADFTADLVRHMRVFISGSAPLLAETHLALGYRDAAIAQRIELCRARIEKASRRTLGLADNFVQLARAESHEYRFEEIDFQDILLDATDELLGTMNLLIEIEEIVHL